jgi:hypothetical protein
VREVVADWRLQDGIDKGKTYGKALEAILAEIGPSAAPLREMLRELKQVPPHDGRWADLYIEACKRRREARLRTVRAKAPQVIFTKHYDMGGSHYAYTEGQSDAQGERTFKPGASLCLLTLSGLFAEVRTLLADSGGVIRDPDVSYAACRVLFSWKKSLNEDDYHLYDLDIATGKVRQLTFGAGFADYEGAYVPNGHIIFNSTRCVQTVDCWWTEVSNLYTCDGEGRYLRRLGFDQVHTNYPTVMPDGRIIYTRWDYNDRGQVFPQGLFQMNPDGTGQTEFYGNNSWFPTAVLHARGIAGTQKVLAVFSGHHTHQQGRLGILDPARGRQENEGAQLIAPVRATPAERIDKYGQKGDQFQYPYPLSETEFLVTFRPEGQPHFAIYWMDCDGRRELLASDPTISCNQPVPLVARPLPHLRRSLVDYRQPTGVYYVQDVYAGLGLAGIPRGTIKRLRVVTFTARAAGIGENRSQGPAGAALSSTPISIGNGAWDPKIVLGEATVHADGSAMFAVPARTPVYFQALDAKGYAVQTMRSWSTLQPGECGACIGCHESKNRAPPAYSGTLVAPAGVEQLHGFYGPPRGFSFAKEIQPILDRHCIACHKERGRPPRSDNSLAAGDPLAKSAFSLLSSENTDALAKRKWSDAYLALTNSRRRSIVNGPLSFTGHPDDVVNWVGTQSVPSLLPPYFAGAAKSRLMVLLEQQHGGARLSDEERRKIACWIDLLVPFSGDYTEANAWSDEERQKYERYLNKRKSMEAIERRNIEAWIKAQGGPWPPARRLGPNRF